MTATELLGDAVDPSSHAPCSSICLVTSNTNWPVSPSRAARTPPSATLSWKVVCTPPAVT
jgi:hypothetical protein